MLSGHKNFVIVYSIISVLTFIFIYVFLSKTIADLFIAHLVDDITCQADSLSSEYYDYLNNDNYTYEAFKSKYETYSTCHNNTSFIVNNSNKLIVSNNYKFIYHEIFNPFLEQSLDGNLVIHSRSFYSLAMDIDVIVCKPIIYNNSQYGVVVISSSYDEIKPYLIKIYISLFICLILILMIAVSYAYSMSKKNIRVLENINTSAKKIADGDYSIKIPITYKGEFAELAKNMNTLAGELSKNEALMDDYLANLSHDFRSPLTSIKGFVQAILDGTIPYINQNKYLNIVLDETNRLISLTNNILLLARMESNTITLDKSTFDIHQVIKKVLIQFEQSIVEKNIDITLLMDTDRLFVSADLNQIQRVLYNLIDNAIKFSDKNAYITIDTAKINDKAHISISDSGIGIPHKSLSQIWNRFHKVDSSRGRDKKGVGLGLAIVAQIIEAHNEKIDVYSIPGKGTTFVFTLQLSK